MDPTREVHLKSWDPTRVIPVKSWTRIVNDAALIDVPN